MIRVLKLFLLCWTTMMCISSLHACKTVKNSSDVQSAKGGTSAVRIRKSVFDPSNKANVDAYVAAFKKLQSTAAGKAAWEKMAAIHNDSCPHGNWYFLPWHRAYLYHFENFIAQVSGKKDFALPYWDWEGPNRNRLPDIALDKNGLFWPGRMASKNSILPADRVGPDAMEIIMNSTDAISFGSGRAVGIRDSSASGLLESMPHNRTHVWVAGDMGSFHSPRDPVFWMHHANVDRIWSSWIQKQLASKKSILPANIKGAKPTTEDWLNQSFKDGFYELDQSVEAATFSLVPVKAAFTTKSMIDSKKTLGFDYDSYVKAPSGSKNNTKPTQQSDRSLQLDSTQNEPYSLTSDVPVKYFASIDLAIFRPVVLDQSNAVVFPIDLSRSKGIDGDGNTISGLEWLKTITNRFQDSKTGMQIDKTMTLFFNSLPVPANSANADLEFYFNTRSTPEKKRDEFIGSYNFFGIDHNAGNHSGQHSDGRGHGVQTINLAFNLVQVMQRQGVAIINNKIYVTMHAKMLNAANEALDFPFEYRENLGSVTLRMEYMER